MPGRAPIDYRRLARFVALSIGLSTLLAVAAAPVHALPGASLTLDRNSGAPGTMVTATYTAPGCSPDLAATVAFSLDSITGPRFGTSPMNASTCSATLRFAVSGSPGVHQIVGYVPNSGAPVGTAQFTILPPPNTTSTSAPTSQPTPVSTPRTTTTSAATNPPPAASPSAIASKSVQNGDGINSILIPLLLGLIALLLIAMLVLLILLLRRRRAESTGTQRRG